MAVSELACTLFTIIVWVALSVTKPESTSVQNGVFLTASGSKASGQIITDNHTIRGL